MSDLIKRQDAIDALNECEDIKGFGYTQMHDAIMEIPSVDIPHSDDWEKYSDKLWQKAYERGKADAPSIDIVRCQDCKYWVYNFNGCSRNPCTEPWYATDFCNYGQKGDENVETD